MSRVLNRFTSLFLKEGLLLPLTVVAFSFSYIGASYQAGNSWIAWHVFGYLPIASFAMIAFALVATRFQDRFELEGILLLAGLLSALFGAEPIRASGIHLHWWYLALVVGILAWSFCEPGWQEDSWSGDTYSILSVSQRIGNLFIRFAIPTVTLTSFLAYGWTWNVAFYVLVADVALFILGLVIYSSGSRSPARAVAST